jgi:hypothetical protein
MQATSPERGRLAAGVALVLIGALFLGAQVVDLDVGDQGWPFVIIVPGVAMLVLGLLLTGPGGLGLAIVGGITTMTGLVLFYQNVTDQWATWAYAWALVAPGGVGLGMLLAGLAHGDRTVASDGARTALVGVGLFAGFGLFFEGVIGLSGDFGFFGQPLVPGALVVVGVLIIAWTLLGRERREA